MKGETRDYRLKISKHRRPRAKDFEVCAPENLPSNLRTIETNLKNNIRERYDSIFNRGLIEYKPGTKAQKRHKIKLHTKHNQKQDFVVYDK